MTDRSNGDSPATCDTDGLEPLTHRNLGNLGNFADNNLRAPSHSVQGKRLIEIKLRPALPDGQRASGEFARH